MGAHKTDYQKQLEVCTDILVDALLCKYEEVTGRKPTDKLREELYQILRFIDG